MFLVSVDAGDSSLSQLTHGGSLECELSLSLSASAVENVASHSLGVCELSRVYGGHRGEEKTSDSRNSTGC